MHTLIAQAPSLQLFAPVLVATGIALFVLVLGRRVAARNCATAVRATERWAPPIPSATDFPLNRVDTRPRPSEPSDIALVRDDLVFEGELRPFDSASATLRFSRV